MAIKLEVSDQIKRKKPVTEANKGYSSAVYQALDDTYVSEWDGKVDPDFIADNVELFIWNTKEYYDEIFNTRRPAHSVAYSGLLGLFQLNVTDYDVNVRITSEMVKQWLKKHGLDYVKLLKPIVDKIEEERAERKAESKKESVNKSSKRVVTEAKKFRALDKKAMALYDAQDQDGFYAFTDDELAKLWSMCAYTEDNPFGAAYDDEVYNAIADRHNSDEIFEKAKSYLNLPKKESVRSRRSVKEEVFPYESKRDSSFPYMYVLTHGFGPGTLPRGVKVGRVEDYKGYTVVWLDRPLSNDELNQYDIPAETYLRKYLGNDLDYFRGLSGLPEGIQRKRSKRSVKESLKDSVGQYLEKAVESGEIDEKQVVAFYDKNNNIKWLGKAGFAPIYLDNVELKSKRFVGNELHINEREVTESKRRVSRKPIRESAWTAPNGKKYGKQKRDHGTSRYIFTRRELKDMVDSGIAQSISNAEEAWKMSDEVIGYSWNETNGFKSGILFTDKDGNLWVGNTGVAQMFL